MLDPMVDQQTLDRAEDLALNALALERAGRWQRAAEVFERSAQLYGNNNPGQRSEMLNRARTCRRVASIMN